MAAEFAALKMYARAAQTGSLLDETRSKLRSSEASCDEIAAQIETSRSGRDPESSRTRFGPF